MCIRDSVEVVELVELIRRSGLGVEEHMETSFWYSFQKMLRPAVEHQQAPALEDVYKRQLYRRAKN